MAKPAFQLLRAIVLVGAFVLAIEHGAVRQSKASFVVYNFCGSDAQLHCYSDGGEDWQTVTVPDQYEYTYNAAVGSTYWCDMSWNGLERQWAAWNQDLTNAWDTGDVLTWKAFGYGFYLVDTDGESQYIFNW